MDQAFHAILTSSEEFMEQFTPLRTIFPINKWHKLRHFELSNFPVRQDDLLFLLAVMPPILRSVELSFLVFLGDGRNYQDMLTKMRDILG